jgi:tRNA(Arg) A34 adenosine deaminase TadA
MEEALTVARREALKSVEVFRLGAALVRRRSVIASGRNRNLNSCGLSSIHAEMDAAWKIDRRPAKFQQLHLVVVRVTRDHDKPGCSKPCAACMRALQRIGIRKITYTTGDSANPLHTIAL